MHTLVRNPLFRLGAAYLLFAWLMAACGSASSSAATTEATDNASEAAAPAAVTAAADQPAAEPLAQESLNALLFEAISRRDSAEVERLLEDGADVNATMTDWSTIGGHFVRPTVIIHAARTGDTGIVELLIAHGADVNRAEEGKNLSPLHIAAMEGHPEVVRTLLENGADPNAVCTIVNQETPLHLAAAYGTVNMLQTLIDGGAEVDARIDQGLTPLLSAITYRTVIDKKGAVTLLLDAGADPNQQNSSGNTALHLAALYGQEYAVPLLVEHGAELDLENTAGKTALEIAMIVDELVAKALREAGARE